MNYYRRYTADYGSKTGALTMLEDGAYTRLLDWYYEHEQPLPIASARIYVIAKAMSAAEKKAVGHVLDAYFEKRADGWHNKRADQELAAALPKLDTLRRVARENGAKGGRPKKTESGSTEKPEPVPNQEPEQEPNRGPDPEPSSQPLNRSVSSTTAFPVMDTSRPEPSKAGGESNPEPPPPGDARLAALGALLRKARVPDVDTADALMRRWLTKATDAQLVRALNDACRSRGGHPFQASYLDPIVERVVDQDRKAREAAESKLDDTQAMIAEQRAWKPSPMPVAAAKFVPKKRPAEDAT